MNKFIIIIIFSINILNYVQGQEIIFGQEYIYRMLQKAEKGKKVIYRDTKKLHCTKARNFNFKEFDYTESLVDSLKIIHIYYDNKNKIQKISFLYQNSSFTNLDLILKYESNYIFMYPILKNKQNNIDLFMSSFFLYEKNIKALTFWQFDDFTVIGGELKNNIANDNVKINIENLKNIILCNKNLEPIRRLSFWKKNFILSSVYTYNINEILENITYFPLFSNYITINKKTKIVEIYNYFFSNLLDKCDNCLKKEKNYSKQKPLWISIFERKYGE